MNQKGIIKIRIYSDIDPIYLKLLFIINSNQMSTACVTDDNKPKVAKNCADNTELSSLSEVNTKFAYSPHCTQFIFRKKKHVMQKSR